ncbi:MAG: integrin alpha [Acidimicrobiales bacterium]
MKKHSVVRRALAASALASSLLTATGPVAPGQAQTAPTPGRLTLAPDYNVQRIDSPEPAVGAGFAGGFVSGGDLDRDGHDDLLVPQFNGQGRVSIISGATGRTIRVVAAPDASTEGAVAAFGRYVAKIDDLGSCAAGQPGQTCATNPIGAPDGVPDMVVGATGVDGTSRDVGRAYLIDGGTGAVLKRIDMPAGDAAAQAALAFPARANFGRTVLVPGSPFPPSAPTAVKIGDLDGGGRPDIVIGAFGYNETGPSDNPACNPGPCARTGRVYFYRGEDLVGTNPTTSYNTPYLTIRNPLSQTDDPDSTVDINSELLGHSSGPIGDIGRCTANPGPGRPCPGPTAVTTTPDGRPDVAIGAFRTNFPPGFSDSGVVYLVDGASGAIMLRHDHPEPQYGAIFGNNSYSQPAIGDVGDSSVPDLYVAAVRQNVQFLGQGRGYVMNGDVTVFPDNVSLALFDDPTPAPGGNFGTSSAGIGDVAGDPRNEIMVGATGPVFPGVDQSIINDVHVFSPITQRAIRTFDDPDQQPGSAFGGGLAPLGDLNADGFLDFAIGAGSYDGTTGANEGRLYIFRSGRSAAPPPTPVPPAPGGGGYRLGAADGGVFAFGDATFLGSTGSLRLTSAIVGMAATPSARGYWLVAGDGGVFPFGDATFLGSMGSVRLTSAIVAMAPTPSGRGYWLVAGDGGVFPFGDATFLGSMGSVRLASPIVGMAPTPTGRGYWLVAGDGGVFAFGDAVFLGSMGARRLASPIVGMAPTPTGKGYWLVAGDGGVFAFGDATFLGSTGALRLSRPVVSLTPTPTGRGYRLVAGDGGVFAFGDATFLGSTGALRLIRPIVGAGR